MSLENNSNNQNKSTKKQSKFISRIDVIIIFILAVVTTIIVAISFIGKSGKADSLLITVGGEEYKTVSLSNVTSPYEINMNDHMTIEIDKNRARVKDSDCKDKICVNSGWLTKPGDTAVCLPNKVAIKILGKPKNVDFIAGG